MLEKRKFIRLKVPLGVVYRVVRKKKAQKPQISFIHDISGAGVSLYCKEDLRHGDLLRIEIQIPHLADPVQVLGEVVWTAPRPEHSNYHVGLRFRDVPAKDLSRILEYVYTIAIG